MSTQPEVSALGGTCGRSDASLWQRIRARFRRKDLTPEDACALWDRQKFNEALAKDRHRAILSLIGIPTSF